MDFQFKFFADFKLQKHFETKTKSVLNENIYFVKIIPIFIDSALFHFNRYHNFF